MGKLVSPGLSPQGQHCGLSLENSFHSYAYRACAPQFIGVSVASIDVRVFTGVSLRRPITVCRQFKMTPSVPSSLTFRRVGIFQQSTQRRSTLPLTPMAELYADSSTDHNDTPFLFFVNLLLCKVCPDLRKCRQPAKARAIPPF